MCADNDGHNTDAIDALTLTVPVILAYADADRSERNAKISEVISLTRKSKVLQPYAEKYSDILVAVLHGMDLRKAIEKVYILFSHVCVLLVNVHMMLETIHYLS